MQASAASAEQTVSSSSPTTPTSATRNYGPDLTGLFTGDCGALGIKAAIRLPLLARREAFEAVSFAFDDFASYHAAVREAALERLDDENFGFDLALSQGQIAKQEGVATKAALVSQVMKAAPGKFSALKQLAGMALAGERAMRAGEWMHHFILEGVDAAEVAARTSHTLDSDEEDEEAVEGPRKRTYKLTADDKHEELDDEVRRVVWRRVVVMLCGFV